jgi:hypothetical protein
VLPAEQRAALGVRWNEPDGGFFLMMRVPFPADNAAFGALGGGLRGYLDADVVLLPARRRGRQHPAVCQLPFGRRHNRGITRLASFIEAGAANSRLPLS